ncbi:MAG: hypothetical protein A2846_02500 [Candidatus Doudnabacteria bacterium RIFCSPHIGHO2_01_FULL_49_9]|uniref:Glycosyltransferase subfamily 4-like N-terminal domain-containing protein n=1 Tax=Candidatus Doudnabacteria bacterium RIFCSPHIGHO2_01_FULL_49_9 TaxID=1817827 RepID=A0A1F5P2Z9_9BACT|nr:MAG: hypothetical protein A2846_02500 [Candidatus Doudnabacteria bacterium RIFCSPHIGHO2_01_FULL_49_9]
MKIAIDIRPLMEGKTTGVEVYLVNLLHNLFQLDQKNQYILWANSLRPIRLPRFEYPNVSTVITKYPNKFFNLAQKLGWPKLETLIGNFDLFFSPHWRVTALDRRIPMVITFHDLVSEFAPEFFTWRRRVWHRFMNYRTAASRAKKIIAVSESTKKDLMDLYGIEGNKIEVIYPGVTKINKLTTDNLHPTGFFLYLGTFEPRKNIEAVIAAYQDYFAQSHTQLPLVIAGSSGWKTKLVVPDDLKSSVTVRKNVGDTEKIELYEHAFAFVFPSFYEGFGFPVLEAASHGLPVITSYNSSIAEVARDFALFINPFRPSQIARAMLELENDNELYEKLRSLGQNTAQRFTWERTAAQTLDLFSQILNSKF